jgi:hypothetical membrane protein
VLGAVAQPASYRSVHDTISALAARGATDRWIMTLAFLVLGACHVVTGGALRRPVLVLGGVATALLALAPQPAHGSSSAHEIIAGIALIALALWPVRDGRVGRIAALVLVALLVVFAVSLQTAAGTGGWERALTVSQALWPAIAVRRSQRNLG